MANTPNLKKLYQDEVAPALMQKFGYKSTMQIPRLDKIVVNVGCSEARENAKVLDAVVSDLTAITGQKAVITKAKKSVANFKLREHSGWDSRGDSGSAARGQLPLPRRNVYSVNAAENPVLHILPRLPLPD